jgi:hypothetical protein
VAGHAVRLALLFVLCLPYSIRPAPWRDVDPLQATTDLPKRLIDSIMAQGNWNILFQQGPFSEFQRQIAIANHFALRGDLVQATRYFDRAGNTLEIAYASLRGKFGWPRNYRDIQITALNSGENKNTFQDFLLCRVQLFIESGLKAHESGIIDLPEFDSMIPAIESQLGQSLGQKDQELGQMLTLIRDALILRDKGLHPALAAQHFAQLTDSLAAREGGYWQRQLRFFCVFENIYYGNLYRAAFLTRMLARNPKKQIDDLGMARMYIHSLAFDDARSTLQQALSRDDNLQPENYASLVRLGEILQNLLIIRNQPNEAHENAANLVEHLESMATQNLIARENIVSFRKTLLNQRLRRQMLDYLNTSTCASTALLDSENQMELEWQVRDRVFHEMCGLPRDLKWWNQVVANRLSSAEIRQVARFHLKGDPDIASSLAKTERITKPGAFIHALEKSPALQLGRKIENPQHAAAIKIQYLGALNRFDSRLAFMDWGILLPEDSIRSTLANLPETLESVQASTLLTELQRSFVFSEFDEAPLALMSPVDNAALRKKWVPGILDLEIKVPTAGTPALRSDKWYIHSTKGTAILFTPGSRQTAIIIGTNVPDVLLEAKKSLSLPKSATVVSGNALSQLLLNPMQVMPVIQIGTLSTYCDSCASSAKGSERLLVGQSSGIAGKLRAELADNFSAAPTPESLIDCATGAQNPHDAVLFFPPERVVRTYPCNLNPEKLVLEYGQAGLSDTQLRAIAAMGWRKDMSVLILPSALSENSRIAFLYDYFQRTNRRLFKTAEAFRDAKARAEKSFPEDREITGILIYESSY